MGIQFRGAGTHWYITLRFVRFNEGPMVKSSSVAKQVEKLREENP